MTFQAKSVPWNETSLASILQSSAGSKTAPIEAPDNTVSMEVEGVTATHTTTEFVDDHVMVAKDESHISHVDYSVTRMGNTQSTIASVTDFLAKPIVLSTGNFALTDSFSIFSTFSMPYAAIQASTALIWRQKLAGFFGIRMDMRFRLVVNANKFQQGRYMLGWTATGGNAAVTSNLKAIEFLYAHNSTLVQRTTVPHVELDLSTQSVAELLVPYASVNSFYPLTSILDSVDRNGLGFISIYPYDPLQAPAGSTSCGYTLYVSFENVELYGAASAQGGLAKREIANKNNGPVSGVAGAISRGFREFSSIPLIGEYAKGISWISDRIANTASIFGFSKPTAGDSVPKMLIVNAPSHSTVDGESDARSLSFLSQPGVVPLKGLSGTDYDEMDFSYLKSKYAWFFTAPWNLSMVPGTLVRSISINPSSFPNTITSAGYNNISYQPMAFLAAQFRYWRGSMKLRFKIVKTEYHSGRLEFAFFPTAETAYVGNSAYVNRIIVDVREHSEIELVIPYISISPWKTYFEGTGVLRITVVDPLVAPSSVSSSVNILMEVAGGEDFEVSGLSNFIGTPTVLVPQGLDGPRKEENIYSSVIGSAVVYSDPHLMTGLTIGDKVSSIRAFLKRFNPLVKASSNTTDTMNTPNIQITPDVVNFAIGTSAAPGDFLFNADPISLWSSCYTFMSGGIRIRDVLDYGMTTTTNSLLHTSVQSYLRIEEFGSTQVISDTTFAGNLNTNRVYQDTSSNNTITVEVPQYTKTFARCMVDVILFQDGTSSPTRNYTFGSNTPYRVIIAAPLSTVVTPQAGHSFHRIFRAGSDDFNLSGFISIPPTRVLAGPNNMNLY